jgi:hypothetical protein
MAKKKASAEFEWSRESTRVQSLDDGKWVRVFDHRGRSHHVPVESDKLLEIVDKISKNDEDCARRIKVQLDTIAPGWQDNVTSDEDDPSPS